jgi:hypothetical protein
VQGFILILKSVKNFLTLELSIPGNYTSIIKNKPQSGGNIPKIAHKAVDFEQKCIVKKVSA